MDNYGFVAGADDRDDSDSSRWRESLQLVDRLARAYADSGYGQGSGAFWSGRRRGRSRRPGTEEHFR